MRVAVSDAAGRLNDHRRLRTCDAAAAAAANNDDYNDIIIIIIVDGSHQYMNNMYVHVCVYIYEYMTFFGVCMYECICLHVCMYSM